MKLTNDSYVILIGTKNFTEKASLVWLVWLFTALRCAAAGPEWQHLSSAAGGLPPPGPSTEQTGAVVADLDRDGTNDFVISFRKVAPALVWYRRLPTGWQRLVIESDYLPLEAGGAVWDIDGDGDLDLVFGGDWQSDELWWWENPYPRFDPQVSWKRHRIKKGGAKQHHDQVFGDFLGAGKPQLAFWNQGSNDLLEREMVHGHSLQVVDIDGDGNLDIFAAEMAKWSGPGKPVDNPNATAWILYGDGRGNFRQTVFSTGIGFHEAKVADLNGDGRLDILDKPYTWAAPRLDVWLQRP